MKTKNVIAFNPELDTSATCFTVGEMIEMLRKLPWDMPVSQEYGTDGLMTGVDVTIYNPDCEDAHLAFEVGGYWSNLEVTPLDISGCR